MKIEYFGTFKLVLLFFACSMKSLFTLSEPDGLLFYIYDEGAWGNISRAALSKRDENEILDRMRNYGAGECMNETLGLYHTDQYQLFEVFFNRARNDCYRRTRDPAKATTFLIPYDFASDVAFFANCPKHKELVCFQFRKCPLAQEVESMLLSSYWYRRNHGHDHLLIIGMNYAMDHYILKPKCKAFISGVCKNCTKLAIDDYSFLFGNNTNAIRDRGDYWHAIPFPADFHWTRRVASPFPWNYTNRTYLVSYLGSTQSHYVAARKLRQSISYFCKLHQEDCVSKTYGANGTRSTNLKRGQDPHLLSKQSVFCFQPIGDLMTRKGLFDGILHGCIPVVFSCLTASCMYTWHWSADLWKDIVIEFDIDEVTAKRLDPVDRLRVMMERDPEGVKLRQERLRNNAFLMQYSLDSPCDEEAKQLWPKDGALLKRDAFDVAIEHTLRCHRGVESHRPNSSAPHCWNGVLNTSVYPNYCMPA